VPHCDDDVLALRALGEPAGTPEDGNHLETCAQCRRHVDDLTRAARIARSVTIEDHQRPKVPDRVWSSILAAIPELAEQSHPPAAQAQRTPVVPITAGAVRRLDPRRSWLVAAAVAAILGVGVGAAGMWAFQRPPSVQASDALRAGLAPLGSPGGHGTAAVEVVGQTRRLQVRLSGGGVPGRFLEVWLADSSADKMVAIGVLDSRQQGTFTLPPALDLSTYRLVDVSAEAYDGNPAHSSISIARGQLRP
jgi:hypothetical protein